MTADELLGLARGGLLRKVDPVRKGVGGMWVQAARVHGLFPERVGAQATAVALEDAPECGAAGPRLIDPAGRDEAAEFWQRGPAPAGPPRPARPGGAEAADCGQRARPPACPDCGEHMAGIGEDEWLLGRA